MKYHCVKRDENENASELDRKALSLCGTTLRTPRTFVYDLETFVNHYAKDLECKNCRRILDTRRTELIINIDI